MTSTVKNKSGEPILASETDCSRGRWENSQPGKSRILTAKIKPSPHSNLHKAHQNFSHRVLCSWFINEANFFASTCLIQYIVCSFKYLCCAKSRGQGESNTPPPTVLDFRNTIRKSFPRSITKGKRPRVNTGCIHGGPTRILQRKDKV